MFAIGSKMLLDSIQDRYRANVAPMTCISPRLGSPRRALMSFRLMANWLPPLSWFILCSTAPRFDDDWPSMPRARRITGAHRATPAPPMFPIAGRLRASARATASTAAFTAAWMERSTGVSATTPTPRA